MSSPSIPAPPPPGPTIAGQTNSNVSTAVAQGTLNNTNQVTPYGSSTFTQGPGTVVSDGNGGHINVPQWTQTQTLSPTEQNLFDINQATKQNIAQIGNDESTRIGQLLGQPIDLSSENVSGYLTDLGNRRLQPILNQQWQGRETDLMNRGIEPGSEQYQREQDAFNRQRNDAYDQLILQGYGQGVQSLLAQRNQPINEISALLNGSQVSQPNFINPTQAQVAPVNVAGITQDAYQNQLAGAQMKNQYNQAIIGGLAGLGGAAATAGFKYSDRRLKTDIEKVGKTDEGTPIYSYRYKGSPTTEIGFMAQDIEKKVPEAVVDLFGLKAVNYKAAIAGGA